MHKLFHLLKVSVILISVGVLSGCVHRPVSQQLGIAVPQKPPAIWEYEGVDVALVLGGGGSKGLAHVGVLEVLEEAGVPIDMIVGTSSGAAVGALYAGSQDAAFVKDKLMKLNKWDLLDLSLFSTLKMCTHASGPVSGYYLEKFFLDNLKQKNIEDLGIKFAAVAVDIETTEPFVMMSGPIAPAVHASAAIPPFFSPVQEYGRKLVDGGIVYPVPVPVAKKQNPRVIISVDISAPPQRGDMNTTFDLNYRSAHISYYELCRMQSALADVDIHPNLEGFGIFDDDQNEEIYRLGIVAARAALPEILNKLEAANIKLRK